MNYKYYTFDELVEIGKRFIKGKQPNTYEMMAKAYIVRNMGGEGRMTFEKIGIVLGRHKEISRQYYRMMADAIARHERKINERINP